MEESNNKITISEQDIERLTKEAVSSLGPDWIYGESMRYLNLEAMKTESEQRPMTTEEIGLNFSVAGFVAGIKFALSNIDISREE